MSDVASSAYPGGFPNEIESALGDRERTEVEQTLETLSRERQRLYGVLETLHVMVCLITPDHEVAFANRAFRQKFGEDRGRRCYEYVFKKTKPCNFCQAFTVLTTRKPHQWELETQEGSVLAVYNYPFVDIDGAPLILQMNLDITEQRRAERERLQLEEQILHAQKMEAIGTLAGGIAHSFNNMLAVIIGNAELALEDIGTDGPYHNLEQILDASKRSRDLVKQILTFSRKNEGRRKELKLIPVIEETVKLLRSSLPTTISIKTDIRAISDTMYGNISQLQQVLMNLANNSAHAIGEDGGTLAIRLSEVAFKEQDQLPDRDLKPGRYLKLTIRDTGSGIPREIRERIFDPFFTTKPTGEGAGMGLAVAFGIVKSHRGTISVASKMGKGSVFKVFLPLSTLSVKEESAVADILPTGKESVLVIDDETSVVEIVAAMLRRLGYQVTVARSGPEGWKSFSSNPDIYDLVITDNIMPQITGLKLAQRILELRSDMPIILLTGYSGTVFAEEARAAGITKFLVKPVLKRELAEAVREVLGGKAIVATTA